MIDRSLKAKSVGEYYFSKKLREMEELSDPPLINLGMGNPDLPPPTVVKKAICHAVNNVKSHQYQSYKSSLELRTAMVEWYRKHFQVSLNPNGEILPLSGSKEGIIHVSLAFLNTGDKVLIPDPGYPTYQSAARLAGGEIIPYSLTEENGWLPDLQSIGKEELKNVKLMWVNYPHMPTGAKGDEKVFSSLIEFGLENDILICHDNPYAFILNDNPISILSLPNAKDTAIELNSLSKVYNMAGWRIGMISGRHDIIQAVLSVRSHVDNGLFLPAQQASIKALNSPESWITDLNKIYQSRRQIVYRILDKLGCKYSKDQAGLFIWASIPGSYDNGEDFSDRLLHEHHVFVTPGIVFGSQGDRYIRVSLCSDETSLHEVEERLR